MGKDEEAVCKPFLDMVEEAVLGIWPGHFCGGYGVEPGDAG